MDGERVTRIRAWLRKHSTVGPLVGGFLGLHYRWTPRRASLVVWTVIVGSICTIILWLPRRIEFKVSHPSTIPVTRQPVVTASRLSDAPATPTDSTKNEARYNSLFLAATKGDDPTVRRLLHEGLFVDALGDDGTALTYAAENGHLSTVKLLMSAGATLHGCDRQSELFDCAFNTALDGAADGGHTEVMRYLLRKGANPNGRDDNGYTPLLRAAASKGGKAVRILLSYGAQPDVQSRHLGYSSLMLASQIGAKDSVKALLRYGADVRAEDHDGHTAKWYARRNRHWAILSVLNEVATK